MSSLIHSNKEKGGIDIHSGHTAQGQQVAVYLENRYFIRSKFEKPIIYTYYDTENFSDEFITEDGTAYNYSENGMYFESKIPLQPDSPIYIRMKEADLSIPTYEGYGGHHAEVKWCKKQIWALL